MFMNFLVYCILSLCSCVTCCSAALRDILYTPVARYCLFVLKVPLNTKQTNKHTSVTYIAVYILGRIESSSAVYRMPLEMYLRENYFLVNILILRNSPRLSAVCLHVGRDRFNASLLLWQPCVYHVATANVHCTVNIACCWHDVSWRLYGE